MSDVANEGEERAANSGVAATSSTSATTSAVVALNDADSEETGGSQQRFLSPSPRHFLLCRKTTGPGPSASVTESAETVLELSDESSDPSWCARAGHDRVSEPGRCGRARGIAGFTPAGQGVSVDLGGGTLDVPATVSFAVSAPPSDSEPVSLHIAGDGTWEFEPASYAEGTLTLSTNSFSIQLPGFLNPVKLLNSLFGGAVNLVGLRTSPPDCGQAPGWADLGGNSVITHHCLSTSSDGVPELVIRSNRSYWIQVNVPEPNRYVWVDSMPAWLQRVLSRRTNPLSVAARRNNDDRAGSPRWGRSEARHTRTQLVDRGHDGMSILFGNFDGGVLGGNATKYYEYAQEYLPLLAIVATTAGDASA